MKKLMIAATMIMTSQTLLAGPVVVYGQDDRKDIYQSTNALHKKLAQSTAGMIQISSFVKGANDSLLDLSGTKTLEEAQNLCTSEAFGDQPLAPICSGFLVGPDTLITAGHCYNSFPNVTPETVCKAFVWVFDYNMKSASSDPTKNILQSNVYRCKSVVHSQKGDRNFDYAVVKLNRPVTGRAALKFRTAGVVPNSTSLVVIGHPNGLPTKISANGRVTQNNEPTRFSTNLDTFHGNSGAAVFDAATGLVEGILIMGKTDYRPSIPGNEKSCQVVNKCDDNANRCTAGVEQGMVSRGEVVLRMANLAPVITKMLSIK